MNSRIDFNKNQEVLMQQVLTSLSEQQPEIGIRHLRQMSGNKRSFTEKKALLVFIAGETKYTVNHLARYFTSPKNEMFRPLKEEVIERICKSLPMLGLDCQSVTQWLKTYHANPEKDAKTFLEQKVKWQKVRQVLADYGELVQSQIANNEACIKINQHVFCLAIVDTIKKNHPEIDSDAISRPLTYIAEKLDVSQTYLYRYFKVNLESERLRMPRTLITKLCTLDEINCTVTQVEEWLITYHQDAPKSALALISNEGSKKITITLRQAQALKKIIESECEKQGMEEPGYLLDSLKPQINDEVASILYAIIFMGNTSHQVEQKAVNILLKRINVATLEDLEVNLIS
jgi:hypothetical protein